MKSERFVVGWKRNRAIIGCDPSTHDVAVSSNNLLLPFSPTMPLAHYEFYKAEAEFPGLVAQYANVLVAGLLRRPPQFRGEPPEGVNVTALLQAGAMEHLTTGSGYIWVDKGVIQVVSAELVKVWSTAGDVVVIEFESEEWVGVDSHMVVYRYEYTMREGSAWAKVYKDNSFQSEVQILIEDQPLDHIPVYPLSGSWAEAVRPSILQALIDREIGLYNKLSRRNHLLYGAATYTPVISDDMDDESWMKIVNAGIGSWIRLSEKGSAEILAAPTEALSEMEKAISSTVQDMARMGIRILSPEGDASSGVALEIRNSSQTAQLGLLNTTMSQVFSRALTTFVRWRDGLKADEVEVMMSADFNPAPLGSEWMRLVTDWYKSRLIPRSLWLQIAANNDVIPADYDDEVGQAEINKDELTIPPVSIHA